jgi:MinD-like ATPase involved in chromosome partitioning or flagellar assembly
MAYDDRSADRPQTDEQAPRIEPWTEPYTPGRPRGVAHVPPVPDQPGYSYPPEPDTDDGQVPLPAPKPSAEPAIPPAGAFGTPPSETTTTFPPYPEDEPDPSPTYHPAAEPVAPPWPTYSAPTQAASPTGAQQFAPPPTAADFAARRVHTPQRPPATMGLQGLVRKLSLGRVAPAPSRRELEHRQAVAAVRRNFGGLRQITVVNPKGGAGKTVAVLMTAMTFGQQRGGYVLSWDNNETQGTLGMRAQQDFHHRTVRDLLAELGTFAGEAGRVGDLSRYVRSQGEAMFDVLASDESATAGEMLTAQAFRNLREVVSRFYKLIVVDTGNNVRAENWQAAIEATDQLVVPMSARGDSAETAARMLDHLDQTGRHELVRRAVSVISMPASTKGADLPAIRNHFAARTRAVLTAPYEPLLDSGEPIRYGDITGRSREAWLRIAASVAEGL